MHVFSQAMRLTMLLHIFNIEDYVPSEYYLQKVLLVDLNYRPVSFLFSEFIDGLLIIVLGSYLHRTYRL